MKRIFILLSVLLFAHLSAVAQTDTAAYAVVKNMPVFYGQMKQQLTYPMAWGKAPVRKFDKWRTQARNVLQECMQIVPPAPSDYAMELIDTERREGYEARKVLVAMWL